MSPSETNELLTELSLLARKLLKFRGNELTDNLGSISYTLRTGGYVLREFSYQLEEFDDWSDHDSVTRLTISKATQLIDNKGANSPWVSGLPFYIGQTFPKTLHSVWTIDECVEALSKLKQAAVLDLLVADEPG